MAKSAWYPDLEKIGFPEELTPQVAVGTLIMTAGAAEAHLSTMILRLMGDDKGYNPLVYPALSGMAFNVKLGVLRALLRLRVPPDLSRVLNEALTLVRGGFDDRNTVAHAYIGRGRHPGELYVRETKLAGGVLPDPAYWPLDRLWKAAHAISEGCDLVDQALDRHGIPRFEPRLPATLAPTPHLRL